jgi:hypothetical protein
VRFRLGRWLSLRTTSLRGATEAWALVSTCWLVRAVALFLLLGTLGIGFSFPLALLLLCAGAAAAGLPIGPAGVATQAGASGAALIATDPAPRAGLLESRPNAELTAPRGHTHAHLSKRLPVPRVRHLLASTDLRDIAERQSRRLDESAERNLPGSAAGARGGRLSVAERLDPRVGESGAREDEVLDVLLDGRMVAP